MLHFTSKEVAMLMNLFHTGMLDSPVVSSEGPIGINVGSDLEAALALGTSNSNDEPECLRPCTTVVHKDITPCGARFRL